MTLSVHQLGIQIARRLRLEDPSVNVSSSKIADVVSSVLGLNPEVASAALRLHGTSVEKYGQLVCIAVFFNYRHKSGNVDVAYFNYIPGSKWSDSLNRAMVITDVKMNIAEELGKSELREQFKKLNSLIRAASALDLPLRCLYIEGSTWDEVKPTCRELIQRHRPLSNDYRYSFSVSAHSLVKGTLVYPDYSEHDLAHAGLRLLVDAPEPPYFALELNYQIVSSRSSTNERLSQNINLLKCPVSTSVLTELFDSSLSHGYRELIQASDQEPLSFLHLGPMKRVVGGSEYDDLAERLPELFAGVEKDYKLPEVPLGFIKTKPLDASVFLTPPFNSSEFVGKGLTYLTREQVKKNVLDAALGFRDVIAVAK